MRRDVLCRIPWIRCLFLRQHCCIIHRQISTPLLTLSETFRSFATNIDHYHHRPENVSAMGDNAGCSHTYVTASSKPMPKTAIEYAHQAEKLSLASPGKDGAKSGAAIKADFITPQESVIVTRDGGRLPAVPRAEAAKLNDLKADVEGSPSDAIDEAPPREKSEKASVSESNERGGTIEKSSEGSLRRSMPSSRTNPLFPPLPLYGPASTMRDIHCLVFRTTSFVLSCTFLGIIATLAFSSALTETCKYIWYCATFRDPDASRPFNQEEKRRRKMRKEDERAWKKAGSSRNSKPTMDNDNESEAVYREFIPTEGGPDPIICDVGYYARRVGLDMEEFRVQTEDGFIVRLWHIYNPREYTPLSEEKRAARGPDLFTDAGPSRSPPSGRKAKYPVLMIHGLLQSSGAFCTLDDDSLAFYLCKSGYDVWLGNNRCGFEPEHTILSYGDPRMWAWNIRQMGVMDLPALTSRVLAETEFSKLALIGHSQGTTETFVALAKEQRPDLGDKISVFCALAPAVYAGPLLGRFYFKFMKLISPAFFRIWFGIHAFIPLMMFIHRYMPSRLYGFAGYWFFTYMFDWKDTRWDRGLRDRCFKFAPVYVSAESMRWWLGRECFAKQKCILATKEESHQEDAEDEMDEYYQHSAEQVNANTAENHPYGFHRSNEVSKEHERKPKGSTAWYDEHVPPMALWVCGSDDLVDGRRLLKRFERGREPHTRIVHQKIIEEYEHLDVIWAMDSIDQVGREVKEVIWKTCGVRDQVRIPRGCEDVDVWRDPKDEKREEKLDEESQSSSCDES